MQRGSAARSRRVARCAHLRARSSAGFGELLAAMKVECRSVHAIAQPGGLRAIVKDVAEMAAAPAAMHFGAGHEETAVGLGLDPLLDRRREAPPPGSPGGRGVGGETRR